VAYRSVESPSTSGYVGTYQALTGLAPADLAILFREAEWSTSYGGERWATIADTIIALGEAIDSRDLAECRSLCARLREIHHNSGPLIPSKQRWLSDSWQREKWPELCDPG
jgi:hypothetical protein